MWASSWLQLDLRNYPLGARVPPPYKNIVSRWKKLRSGRIKKPLNRYAPLKKKCIASDAAPLNPVAFLSLIFDRVSIFLSLHIHVHLFVSKKIPFLSSINKLNSHKFKDPKVPLFRSLNWQLDFNFLQKIQLNFPKISTFQIDNQILGKFIFFVE